MKGVKQRDIIMGAVWVLLGITIAVWSATFPFGGLKAPGPALLPLVCGLVLILLGVILLIQTRAQKVPSSVDSSARLFPDGAAGRRVGLTLAVILASAILLQPVGFGLTAFFLLLFLMRAIEQQRWRVVLFYAFVSSAGVLIVFKILLKTQLPEGFLGF
jgi:hypothetical protein